MQIASHITRGLICLCEGRPLYEVFIIEMVQLQAENAVAGCRVKLLCRSENDYYSSYCCSRCCLRTQFTGCHQTVQLPEFHQSESSIVRVERLSWNLSPASPNSGHTKIPAYLHIFWTGGRYEFPEDWPLKRAASINSCREGDPFVPRTLRMSSMTN